MYVSECVSVCVSVRILWLRLGYNVDDARSHEVSEVVMAMIL